VAVYIKGLNETVRSMERLGVEAQDLRDAFGRITELAYGAAQRHVPRGRTGKLAGGIRKSRRKNAAVLYQGRRSPVYMPYAMFGAKTWPRPVPYLYMARSDVEGQVQPLIERELNTLISRLGL
jgi:hypothetical protein